MPLFCFTPSLLRRCERDGAEHGFFFYNGINFIAGLRRKGKRIKQKSIIEMNDRDREKKRRQCREYSERYRKKKKKVAKVKTKKKLIVGYFVFCILQCKMLVIISHFGIIFVLDVGFNFCKILMLMNYYGILSAILSSYFLSANLRFYLCK